jgi:hypothetical protein
MKAVGALVAAGLGLAGCSATLPHAVLVPGESEHVAAYFNRGAPFAVVRGEHRTTVAALEPAVLAREGYLRLWLYVQNEEERGALEFDPQHDLSMNLRIESRNEDRAIQPASPDGLLEKMTGEDAGRPSQRFEKKVSPSDDETGVWMEAYRRDTSHHGSERTMLRRETILPGGTAHGFVYFPVPMRFRIAAGESLTSSEIFMGPRDGPRSLEDFHVKVRMRSSSGTEDIAFEPTKAD